MFAGIDQSLSTSITIHTSQHGVVALDLAREKGETWPEVQKKNAGMQTQANLEESMFFKCQSPVSGASQWICAPTRFKHAAKSTLEWLHNNNIKIPQWPQRPDLKPPDFLWNEDRAILAKSKHAKLMQIFPGRREKELLHFELFLNSDLAS